MPIGTEATTVEPIDGTQPVTPVNANRKRDIGTSTFNWSVALILLAWGALFALIWSLRKYNI